MTGPVHLVLASAGLLLVAGAAAGADDAQHRPDRSPTADQLAFFEKNIRPVLAARCYSCHSAEAKQPKGGLRLDTRQGLLQGGDSGPALVPGNPKKSLLIQALHH